MMDRGHCLELCPLGTNVEHLEYLEYILESPIIYNGFMELSTNLIQRTGIINVTQIKFGLLYTQPLIY